IAEPPEIDQVSARTQKRSLFEQHGLVAVAAEPVRKRWTAPPHAVDGNSHALASPCGVQRSFPAAKSAAYVIAHPAGEALFHGVTPASHSAPRPIRTAPVATHPEALDDRGATAYVPPHVGEFVGQIRTRPGK